ncbi:MAG: DUF58 domain-containing protein [Treponema sp.]|jgi:uncharacterized protein (DUF58 family)|nr:DUF58 domain-containing protein [Treponema sp.]
MSPAAFYPRTMGVFVFLIVILAFIAGLFRNELALLLVAAVLLVIWTYCLLFTLILAFLNRKRARSFSFRISPGRITAGEETALLLEQGSENRLSGFFVFPAVIARCRINLYTKDGRLLRHIFNPVHLENGISFFTVPERGAWYCLSDEVLIMDSLGFFCFSYRSFQKGSPRLLAGPRSGAGAEPVHARSGGEEQRNAYNYQRTDNLIEHRPYIPGDDPRRINWKLYSHQGELFVREGEREPPPHSRLTILVDTQTDPALYSERAGRQAADMLCEYALAAALDCAGKGIEIRIGWIGGGAQGQSPEELSAALAYPAALPLKAAGELASAADSVEAAGISVSPDAVSPERGCLILALPRNRPEADAPLRSTGSAGGDAALDRFLRKQGPNQRIELLFLYGGDDPETGAGRSIREAAQASASSYGQKPGLNARPVFYDRIAPRE